VCYELVWLYKKHGKDVKMSNLLEKQEIDIDLVEVPVTFKSKKGNKTYFVREMPAPELFAFIDENKELASSAVLSETTKIQIDMSEAAKAIPLLLARCLFDEDGGKIPKEEIDKLSLRVQQKLMEIAQEVNGLTSKAAERAGNSQAGSETGIDLLPGSTAPLPSVKEKQESDDSSNG